MNITNNKIRLRFAPSPTGFFHIGSARTALFNWLYAQKNNGVFILRIEDTDEKRNIPKALDSLINSLHWLGINWDEGPIVGGKYGPYFQSQRENIYKEYANKLISENKAYKKDNAVWLKVSQEVQEIKDEIRGIVKRKEEKDFIIIRSNGKPVFHFAVVVDDITMGITHIIRGEDHLSNTSKHIEIFKAFDAIIPKFAHIPLILNQNGSGKMSKRDSGALIEEYQNNYFISEAMINYLSLLGWSPKNNCEFLELQDIINSFNISDVNKNNARFDNKKLSFINTQYIRNLAPEKFLNLSNKYILEKRKDIIIDCKKEYLLKSLMLCQKKISSIEDLPFFLECFLKEDYFIDSTLEELILMNINNLTVLRLFLLELNELIDFNLKSIEKLISTIITKYNDIKLKDLLRLIRFSISGRFVGPALYPMIELLGKNTIINRINKLIKKYK